MDQTLPFLFYLLRLEVCLALLCVCCVTCEFCFLECRYCTGGVRCEMASAYIRSKGKEFEDVVQVLLKMYGVICLGGPDNYNLDT